MSHRRVVSPSFDRSAFAGFRFPPDVILLAVRWDLRYGLRSQGVGELLARLAVEAAKLWTRTVVCQDWSMSGYDVIGDIHGHADKLIGLLRQMGYEQRSGAWRHAERTAVFVGDLIDRGPQQRTSIEIPRAMVEAGSAHAVLGNHEFNAIAYA